MGTAVGAAQADKTQSRRRIKTLRMSVSIFEPVVFTTTLQRGLVQIKKQPLELNQINGKREA